MINYVHTHVITYARTPIKSEAKKRLICHLQGGATAANHGELIRALYQMADRYLVFARDVLLGVPSLPQAGVLSCLCMLSVPQAGVLSCLCVLSVPQAGGGLRRQHQFTAHIKKKVASELLVLV